MSERNATDSEPTPLYAIRKCRGDHWHVCGTGPEEYDLATRPDKLTYEQALDICSRLNAGEELDDIERWPNRSTPPSSQPASEPSDTQRLDWLESIATTDRFRDIGWKQITFRWNPRLSFREAIDEAKENPDV